MNKIVNKLLIIFFTVLISFNVLCTNPFVINADEILTIDGETFVVDSFSKDLNGYITRIVKNGIEFLADTWARKNLSSNTAWAKTIAQGIITYSSLSLLQSYATASDVINKGFDSAKEWVLDGFDKVKDTIANGTFESRGEWLLKRLLGAGVGLADTYATIKDAVLDLNRTSDISSYRNYYDNTLSNTSDYAVGNTKYYSVADNRTFYNTVNNTYETVNNYNYDIDNHYYNYYTTENHYHVANNYSYTYVFNNTQNYDYSLYYSLPDGTNSYNLTEDDILGYKVDLTVDNYQVHNADADDVMGLYHFNGDNTNVYSSDYSNADIFESGSSLIPYSSNTYVDGASGFNSAYYHPISSTSFLDLADNLPIYNLRFKMYIADNQHSSSLLTLGSSYPTTSSQYLQNVSVSVNANTWNDFEFNLRYGSSAYQLYINGGLVSTFCGLLNGHNYSISNDVDVSTIIDLIKALNPLYTDVSITNIVNTTNYIYVDYDYVRGDTLYNSSVPFVRFSPHNSFSFKTLYDSSPYLLFDELRISDKPLDNHGVNFIPYSDGYVYTLPNTDTNNKLLIKSNIAVNDFQFGGVRSSYSNSKIGDVFINTVDGVITDIEQFNGVNWLGVDGAVYSDKLGKWVNAVGYSILSGDWSYSDLSSSAVSDTSSLAGWLGSLLNSISDTISSGFESVGKTLGGLADGLGLDVADGDIDTTESAEKEFAKGLLKNNDIDVVDTFDEAITEMKDLADDINISNLDTELETEESSLKVLSNSINSIFDTLFDNGVGLLILAPLIICIVRLVI